MTASTLPVSIVSFQRVDQDIQASQNQDKAFWWNATGPSLATLLQTSKYSEEEQVYYLQWYQEWIMSSFGPAPVDGKLHYRSSFTHDGSPIEFSLNWKEKEEDGETIRFCTEPTSLASGDVVDRLDQLAAKDLLTALADKVSGIDLAKFDFLLSEFCVPKESADGILQKIPTGIPRFLVLTAFDLENGGIVAKAYFNPVPKATHTGKSTNSVTLDAVRKLKGPAGTYATSVEVLDSYFRSFKDDETPLVFLLSNDCVPDSRTTRFKVYASTLANTLAQVKYAFHAGGRITGSTTRGGLDAIKQFWCHRFGLDSSDPEIENKEVLEAGARTTFVYEMRPVPEGGEANIEVKLHMPGSWLGETDAEISKVLSTWFRKHGHAALAERYEQDLQSTFPKHDLHSPHNLTHTWVSLTWTPKTGLYMTMYYTAKLPQVGEWTPYLVAKGSGR
ncbi:aromatic prenyltransferase [Xylariaceae sp. AK1471]|nr:aromatic prenyltransferase [Xylariaceae sp. AK1471]